MFEDFLNECPIKDMEKVSRKRINADRTAVRSRIMQEDAMYGNENKISKNHVKKGFAAAAACAAATMTLTVSVSALSGFDFIGMVRSWFSAEAKDNITDRLTEAKLTDYENSFKDLDFKLLGSVTDDLFSTIFIEITRNDGIFDCAEYVMGGNTDDVPAEYLINTPSYSFMSFYTVCDANKEKPTYYEENLPKGLRTFIVDDNDPLDNKLTAAFCLSTESIKEGSVGDTANLSIDISELRRTVNSVKRYIADEKCTVLDTELTDDIKGIMSMGVEISLKQGEIITVEPDVDVSMEITPVKARTHEELINKFHTFNLRSFSITATSLSYELYGTALDGADEHAIYIWNENVKVNMKNGDSFVVNGVNPFVLQFYNKGVHNIDYITEDTDIWYQKNSFMLGRVIDINNVASVEIGGQTIKL